VKTRPPIGHHPRRHHHQPTRLGSPRLQQPLMLGLRFSVCTLLFGGLRISASSSNLNTNSSPPALICLQLTLQHATCATFPPLSSFICHCILRYFPLRFSFRSFSAFVLPLCRAAGLFISFPRSLRTHF